MDNGGSELERESAEHRRPQKRDWTLFCGENRIRSSLTPDGLQRPPSVSTPLCTSNCRVPGPWTLLRSQSVLCLHHFALSATSSVFSRTTVRLRPVAGRSSSVHDSSHKPINDDLFKPTLRPPASPPTSNSQRLRYYNCQGSLRLPNRSSFFLPAGIRCGS